MSRPEIEHWRAPAKTGLHEEVCPFKTTLWNILDTWPERLKHIKKTFLQNCVRSFGRQTAPTSRGGLQSNASKISCVIESNWFIQE